MSLSSTSRTRLTRHAERGRTDRADLYAVLDTGLVAHVGLVRDGAPVVLPMGYGRAGDTLYLHGSTGAGWARALHGAPVCVTVTHLDGIVYARSVFDHSMNYRCAIVHGESRLVTDPGETDSALKAITEQLSPGSWSYARLPTKRELAATTVLAVDLAEASVKVRSGGPGDEPEDVAAGGRWAGVLPVQTSFGAPEPGLDLETGVDVPAHIRDRRG
ncbi:MAG: pyridoxamine 5'-phosphate oxidase family protein [Microlunatus sp.]|nr:pyridoxamine 5'-phosphate oxidase family protein [Microlunatus sp.]MDN5770016.1 pyridoxamine 5'-phosphate oxidase family protein [Microlunatus sp.]